MWILIHLNVALIELLSYHHVTSDLVLMPLQLCMCGSFQQCPTMPKMNHLTPPYHALLSACCQLEAKSRPAFNEVLAKIEQL